MRRPRTSESTAALRRVHGSTINLQSAPQMAEYRAAADRIAADGHRSVLDWGCGHGQLSDLLGARGLKVTSIDYDPSASAITTRRLELFPGIEATYTSDPIRLPYADDSFPAVLSMGVLEHVAYPAESLDELHRVLSTDGLLYVYKLPNRYSYLEAIARHVGSNYFHGQLPADTLWTVGEARAALSRHGFEVVEAQRMNMLPLTVPGRVTTLAAPTIGAANRALSRVPVINSVATNIELVARAR